MRLVVVSRTALAVALTLRVAGVPAQPAAMPTAPSAASAPVVSIAPIEFRNVDAALKALEARDGNGTVVVHTDGWTIVNEPLASTQWSFTPAGHYAYPAVVRRVIRRDAGNVTVDVSKLCEAGAEACARLQTEFEGMNDRITQAIKARGRQGSTPPPPSLPSPPPPR